MRRVAIMLGLTVAVGIAFGVIGNQVLNAQQPTIKRTDVLMTEIAGMEGKEAHMWVAEIAPGVPRNAQCRPQFQQCEHDRGGDGPGVADRWEGSTAPVLKGQRGRYWRSLSR